MIASVSAVQLSSELSLYNPPISVLAYATPFVVGLNTIPGTKPPPPPIFTLDQVKAAEHNDGRAVAHTAAERNSFMVAPARTSPTTDTTRNVASSYIGISALSVL